MYRKAVVLLVMLALMVAVGCSARSRPAVPTAEVAVIMPGEQITANYKVLRSIRKMVDVATADSVLILLARAEAASVGADALLIRELREYEEGRIDARRPVRQKRLIGDAIYFTDPKN
jgi:hypothetical protein